MHVASYCEVTIYNYLLRLHWQYKVYTLGGNHDVSLCLIAAFDHSRAFYTCSGLLLG